MKKTVEVYILGGFLGSGKTTLLKEIISQENEQNRKTAVLVNELGSVSVDTAQFEGKVPLKELLGGCICCTMQDKLETQLADLLSQYDLDAIYIETTGAAHPVEVLDGIMSPLFAGKLEYKGIITVVDLLSFGDRDQLSPQLRQLLIEQVHHADFLLLNKQDLVSEFEAANLLYSVQSINPDAFCMLTEQAKIPLSALRKIKRTPKTEHQQLTVHDHLHLQAIVHTFNEAVGRSEFEEWLQQTPDTIYRMKGYVMFTDSDYPDLFQYSYGMPLFLKESMKMPLTLVIIGEELDENELHDQLHGLETK
jgi:G3E family GTPase